MEVKGKIEVVTDAVTGETKSGENWAKRTIVINDGVGDYPNRFVMTLFKKGEYIEYATDKFNYKEGDEIKVEYSTRANEYKGNWYGDNSIFKIELLEGGNTHAPTKEEADKEDDLPF